MRNISQFEQMQMKAFTTTVKQYELETSLSLTIYPTVVFSHLSNGNFF